MPRANVPLGRASKRSCSIASICRAANLSCCATSAIDRPSAVRAAASSAPTPAGAAGSATASVASAASVILSALQLLVFARGGKTPPQLVCKVRFRGSFPELSLDAQREPQGLCRRLHDPIVAADELARVLEAALAVADLAQLQQGARLVGLLP